MSKNILLIITGSIAAYQTVDLARLLESHGYKLTIILSKNAKKFVSPLSLKSMCKATIYSNDLWQDNQNPMLHIDLSRDKNLILVAPASADFIAKLSAGFADNLALATILAANIPVILAPAMNPEMYNNAATQHNLSILEQRGYKLAGPIYGQVACKETGFGKYLGNEDLLKIIAGDNSLKGKKAVITLGNTREAIDPVRFIGNISSGEQGILIAKELLSHGCEVEIIAGYTSISLPSNIKTTIAHTAQEMLDSSLQALPADIYIGCAAICDFKPKNIADKKIKKNNQNLTIEFKPNIDVIKSISSLKKRPKLVVGFALESENFAENAKDKLKNKNLDMIILNKTANLGKSHNDFTIYNTHISKEFNNISKSQLAEELVKTIISTTH